MRGVLKYGEGRDKPARNVERRVTANTICEFRAPGLRKVVFISYFLSTFKKKSKSQQIRKSLTI